MSKRVAVLGPEGSFSEEAAISHYGEGITPVYAETLEDVLALVERGEADVSCLPVATSEGGPVGEALDALARHPSLYINAESYFDPVYCLLGLGKISDIEVIGSHPQALIVFKDYLDENLPHVRRHETPSTSYAASEASQNPTYAAIASKKAAKKYGLNVLHKIQLPPATKWKPTPEELQLGINPS